MLLVLAEILLSTKHGKQILFLILNICLEHYFKQTCQMILPALRAFSYRAFFFNPNVRSIDTIHVDYERKTAD